MIKHVVIASALPEATEADLDLLVSEWRKLPERIPGIVSMTAGRDLGLRGTRRTVGAISEFESVAAWRNFLEHPSHLAFRDGVSSRVLDPSSLAIIQFEQ